MTFNGFDTEFGPMALIVRYYRNTYVKLSTVYYKSVFEDDVP